MKDWEKFKIGKYCNPFDLVSYTSHVNSAVDIIRDKEIRPSLVFDELKLNKYRILVSWLSPNYWGGFRYGNIRFQFDFASLIRDRLYYWVECIAYKVPACRILITDINRDEMLQKYDPKVKPNFRSFG